MALALAAVTRPQAKHLRQHGVYLWHRAPAMELQCVRAVAFVGDGAGVEISREVGIKRQALPYEPCYMHLAANDPRVTSPRPTGPACEQARSRQGLSLRSRRMGNNKLLLSARLVREFSALCNWAFYVYQLHGALFDKAAEKKLAGSAAGAGLGRLSLMSQHTVLLELAKLHDPAASGRDITLGIDFVVRFGGWSAATRSQLDKIAQALNDFYEGKSQGGRRSKSGVKVARNRVICHNDLEALASGETLGGFTEVDGARYFDNLQKLVNLFWLEIEGHDFPFDALGAHEGAAVLRAVMTGDTKERARRSLAR